MKRFWNDENGAAMAEMGLMLALIAVVCIGTVGAVGWSINWIFNDAHNTIIANYHP